MTDELLERRAAVHAALGDPTRLAIVDALRCSDRSPDELAALVGAGTNLLAHHLAVLERAGVIHRSVSHGDRRRRYVHLAAEVVGLVCEPPRFFATNLLFVCTRNSARSPLAAAIWNEVSSVRAFSAGTDPADAVHPLAIEAAQRVGLDLREVCPRRWDELEETADLVVSVCDEARETRVRGMRPSLHWSLPDPAVLGVPAAFDETVEALRARIDALACAVVPA